MTGPNRGAAVGRIAPCDVRDCAGHVRDMDHNRAVRQGSNRSSAEQFDALYAAHHPQVFGYLLRRCERADDAADAIAETFLVVWRRWDELPTGDDVRPWLYGVARRVLANQRRSAQRRSALAARLEAELTVRPLPLELVTDTADEADTALGRALAALSEDDREILTLEAWEELRPAEIAVVLGCSPGAARTRLHRARQHLREMLQVSHAQIDHGGTPSVSRTGGTI